MEILKVENLVKTYGKVMVSSTFNIGIRLQN